MSSVFGVLMWPLATAYRFGLGILIWFRPEIAYGRCVFHDRVRRLIEKATAVEVHYAELGSDEPSKPGQIGTSMGFRSLGMVRLKSDRDLRRVIRSVLEANRECLGGFKCLDAEYGLRFESDEGGAELMICFWCMQVWVKAEVEGAGRFYPISGRPRPLLDKLLRAAGIPRPPPHEE